MTHASEGPVGTAVWKISGLRGAARRSTLVSCIHSISRHITSRLGSYITLRMEAVRSPEISVDVYRNNSVAFSPKADYTDWRPPLVGEI
jgi:hypothetical protein